MRTYTRPKGLRPKMARQSLQSHKDKWLARLSPKSTTVKKVCASQHLHTDLRGRKKCFLFLTLWTISKSGRVRREDIFSRKLRTLPLNAIAFRALDALVAEGKIQTNMTYNEWLTQLALGTATQRTFYREVPNKVL